MEICIDNTRPLDMEMIRLKLGWWWWVSLQYVSQLGNEDKCCRSGEYYVVHVNLLLILR